MNVIPFFPRNKTTVVPQSSYTLFIEPCTLEARRFMERQLGKKGGITAYDRHGQERNVFIAPFELVRYMQEVRKRFGKTFECRFFLRRAESRGVLTPLTLT
ncbi:MAG: hypothetical protein HYV45_02960 [Candidatus Moranbacteria bacterium]|nr:hypothetical protein [Candidatus Moranbacteria bacterium]